MVKTKDPDGKWDDPMMIKRGKGLIAPCPLWDDDGKVDLVYAYVGSRASIKSVIAVCEWNVNSMMLSCMKVGTIGAKHREKHRSISPNKKIMAKAFSRIKE